MSVPLTIISTRTEIEQIRSPKASYYSGDKRSVDKCIPIYKGSGTFVEYSSVQWNHAVVQMYMEILINAIDNSIKHPNHAVYGKQTYISIAIDPTLQQVTIANDGHIIEVNSSSTDGIYPQELVFGELRTSTNYDIETNATGQNGIGAKMVNIFSNRFEVEVCDPFYHRKYVQCWELATSIKHKPTITSYRGKTSKTRVSYILNFDDFSGHPSEYTTDDINVFRHLALAASATTGLKVTFNNEEIYQLKAFRNYFDYFNLNRSRCIEFKTTDSQWLLFQAPSPNANYYISYVNGAYIVNNGVHVDIWFTIIFKAFKEKYPDIKVPTVKAFMKYFCFIINYKVISPCYDTQYKDKLKGMCVDMPNGTSRIIEPAVEIPSKDTLSKIVSRFKDWEFMKHIKSELSFKIDKVENATIRRLQKTTADSKHFAVNGWGPDYKHANTYYICVITEGDSASDFPVQGASTMGGSNKFGFYTGKGKPINGSKASNKKLDSNVLIRDFKKIFNIRSDLDYTVKVNWESLFYKEAWLLSDADEDGAHINALMIANFRYLNPTLLQVSGFIRIVFTPIIYTKALGKNKKGIKYYYYTVKEYNDSCMAGIKQSKPTYNKGLGGWNGKYAKILFNQCVRLVTYDEQSLNALDVYTTNEKNITYVTDEYEISNRKRALDHYIEFTMPNSDYNCRNVEELLLNMYFDNDLMYFNYMSTYRAIPSVIDSFKECQRKIMHVVRTLTEPVVIKLLAARVADKTAYTHGADSLANAICKMAQRFPGTNNVSMIKGKSQIGNLRTGKSAADRYVKVRPSHILQYIIRKDDDNLYQKKYEQGMLIEPEFFLTTLCMTAINGSNGIATAYMSYIPPYHPIDVLNYTRHRLDPVSYPDRPILHPHYLGFGGTITPLDEECTKYEIEGVYERKSNGIIVIHELPIGPSYFYKKYAEKILDPLKGLKSAKDKDAETPTPLIRDYSRGNMDDMGRIPYTIHPISRDFNVDELKLKVKISLNNMVLIDASNRVKRYNSIYEIIDEHFEHRLVYLERRRQSKIEDYNLQISKLNDIMSFIMAVINHEFEYKNKSKADFRSFFNSKGYASTSEQALFAVRSIDFTLERIAELQSKMDELTQWLQYYEETTAHGLWLSDLDELEPVLLEVLGYEVLE